MVILIIYVRFKLAYLWEKTYQVLWIEDRVEHLKVFVKESLLINLSDSGTEKKIG